MQIIDKQTGFLIADPDMKYFSKIPDYNSVIKSSESMILSASGWRKIFAIDGNEESKSESISPEDYIIASIMALSFSGFIKKRVKGKLPLILLGMDSRFTGPAIADAMARIFLSQNINVRYLFIIAAPEIMAYSKCNPKIDGFAYISASHNPIGHNGLKFGADGGVYGGDESKELISTFKDLLSDNNIVNTVNSNLNLLNNDKYLHVINDIPIWKKEALTEYLNFSKSVIADSNESENISKMHLKLKSAATERNIGIISELNGSARTLSIDKTILNSFGISVKSINDKPREIVHRIVPEGFSLDTCRQELENAYKEDSRYILGYVPDNDGDRGNLVYIDEKSGIAEILEAQEVFALSVLSELAFMTLKRNDKPLAIAVNGPTSMRIDTIAYMFSTRIFRAEVGEANVVNLARNLRKNGYIVRILGEGSNGGNITHPASVRDPINTVFSVIKLLLFEDLFKLWCELSGNINIFNTKFQGNYGISDILSTLPAFTTTSAYDKKALMKIESKDHKLLKLKYEEIFLLDWNEKKHFLNKEFNITSWREVNYETEDEKTGFGQKFRSGLEKGGLKIIFSDNEGLDTDYIWMRGSGTEPVFRVLADCKGNSPEREAWLLQWHRSMIERADK
jgi:phosphoglucomutase